MHAELMVDENRHRYFVVYFYRLQRGLTVLWENRQSSPVTRATLRSDKNASPCGEAQEITRRELTDKAFDIFNHMVVADKDERRWCRVSGMISRIRSLPSPLYRLLVPPGMPSGCTHTVNQFTVRVAGGAWVEINTAFQQLRWKSATSEPI